MNLIFGISEMGFYIHTILNDRKNNLNLICQIGKVELFSTHSSVRELMTDSGYKDLVTITSDTLLSDAISTMNANNIRRLPISNNKDKRMIGIITDRDILKIYPR